MIDKVLVTRKINLISEDFEALRSLASLSYDDYAAKETNEVLAERYLERMIGRMIDVNYHIITEEGHPPPSDYFRSFLDLAKIGVLPRGFAEQIAPCAGLRNRIVHEYNEIDVDKVYQSLQAVIKDVPSFLEYIMDYVSKC